MGQVTVMWICPNVLKDPENQPKFYTIAISFSSGTVMSPKKKRASLAYIIIFFFPSVSNDTCGIKVLPGCCCKGFNSLCIW